MARDIEEIENELMELSLKERALLAEHLIGSLEQGDDIDVEEEWLLEAERRYQRYRAGKTQARPAEQVFSEIKARLK